MPDEQAKLDLSTVTLDDAIRCFKEPNYPALAEENRKQQENLAKKIRAEQTALLIHLIKSHEINVIKSYLDFLSRGKPLEQTLDYTLSDNFLTEALKINHPDIIELLLIFLKNIHNANYKTHAIVLFALTQVTKDNVEAGVDSKLRDYLDSINTVAEVINHCGLFALSCAVSFNVNPRQSGFMSLEYLFVKYYPYKHARKKVLSSRLMGPLPEIFSYAILNNRFTLAEFLLGITHENDIDALVDRCTKDVPLIHLCFADNNHQGIGFLVSHGADICAMRECKYAMKTQFVDIKGCGYLTIIELSILTKNNEALRLILSQAIDAIIKRKLKNTDVFLKHLVDVCENYPELSAMNVFHEFDLITLLFNQQMPGKSGLSAQTSQFHDAIYVWLTKYYDNKSKYNLMREMQPSQLILRIDEIDTLLNILNFHIARTQSSFLYRFQNALNPLTSRERQCILYAIERLSVLGHLVEYKSLSDLHSCFQKIRELLKIDLVNLQSDKAILREYESTDLAISLLSSAYLQKDTADAHVHYGSAMQPLLRK